MQVLKRWLLITPLLLLAANGNAVTIRLSPMGPATVWGQNQVISGVVSGSFGEGTLYVNDAQIPFAMADSTFSVSVRLGNGTTSIVARIDSAGIPFLSDTLRLTLGYRLEPECYAYATGGGTQITLHAAVVDNPETSAVSFLWSADIRNPFSLTIANGSDSVASSTLPPGAPDGEYYFDLRTISDRGDTTRARTLVTVDSGQVHPFDIRTDHAHWIDTAIVYGITPSIFVMDGRFTDITAKLPEIASLGVTAIWVQPVYRTHAFGQGYDVTDYFSLRGDLGSEAEFRTMIATAHALGLRVVLDFVPNHTSIDHPYAVESSQYGTQSHYWDFYQRVLDNAPYSSNYHQYQGFINYFWNDLPNLNYDNPEVRRWITEAGKYWIEKYDIDGYRVDVAWGVNARAPDFTKAWRLALKRIKPEILLLAEDKAPSPTVFDQRFDAAYDWTAEESWVSHWVWETTYNPNANPTIFNTTSEAQRAAALRSSLTNNGSGYHQGSIIFRYMENNDTFRFLATHDLPRTKMVAELLFSLNGIPLIFNGQEIGAATHPYNAISIFNARQSIQANDPNKLFPFYQRLTGIRRAHPALTSRNFNEISVSPSTSVYAFRRWQGTQNVLTVVNMGGAAATPTVSVPTASMHLDSSRTYFLNDLVTGESFPGKPAALSSLVIPVPGYSTRILSVDTNAITGVDQLAGGSAVPEQLSLFQNYPNPFNPSTIIRYTIAGDKGPGTWNSNVRLVVYDVLGREVQELVNENQAPGNHQVTFDGARLSSGAYFYRLTAGNVVMTRSMVLVK